MKYTERRNLLAAIQPSPDGIARAKGQPVPAVVDGTTYRGGLAEYRDLTGIDPADPIILHTEK